MRAGGIAPMLVTPKSQAVYDFTDAFVVTGGGLFARAPDLVQRLDAGLAAIRADGTLQRIEAAWSH